MLETIEQYDERQRLEMLRVCPPFELSTAFKLGLNTARARPIDMLIFCPDCGHQHVDKPEPNICVCGCYLDAHHEHRDGGTTGCAGHFECKEFKIAWDNPPHKSHTCRTEDGGCGKIFRIADYWTNGVAEIKTRGRADTWPKLPCPGPCDVCEGTSHHWMEHQDENDPEKFYWKCKHCSHQVEYGEPKDHPDFCDCPNCVCECSHLIGSHTRGPGHGCREGYGIPDATPCKCEGFVEAER
jgi:hypothetical protein